MFSQNGICNINFVIITAVLDYDISNKGFSCCYENGKSPDISTFISFLILFPDP